MATRLNVNINDETAVALRKLADRHADFFHRDLAQPSVQARQPEHARERRDAAAEHAGDEEPTIWIDGLRDEAHREPNRIAADEEEEEKKETPEPHVDDPRHPRRGGARKKTERHEADRHEKREDDEEAVTDAIPRRGELRVAHEPSPQVVVERDVEPDDEDQKNDDSAHFLESAQT